MFRSATSAFALPDHLAAKAAPALIARDEQQFAAISAALEQQVADVLDRLAVLRKEPGGKGRQAMDRDIEIHHLSARLRVLRRFGLDVCLGRMVATDEEPVYVGRVALADSTGEPLLLTPGPAPHKEPALAHPPPQNAVAPWMLVGADAPPAFSMLIARASDWATGPVNHCFTALPPPTRASGVTLVGAASGPASVHSW